MKKELIFLALLGLLFSCGQGNSSQSKNGADTVVESPKDSSSTQNTTQTVGSEEAKSRLLYLNSLYLQAYVRSDTTTYDTLLWAKEFTQTDADGKVSTRAEMMKKFGTPRFEAIEYFYVTNVEVTFLSEDKAVISATNPYGFKMEGKLVKGISRYKDTYVKREGVWKCISAVIEKVS